MKEFITVFDGKTKTVQQILDDGMKSKVLRDNPIFNDAIRDVYWRLTLAEDLIVADMKHDDRSANAESKRIAKMRSLLAEIVTVLDGNIQEAENAKFNMETNNDR